QSLWMGLAAEGRDRGICFSGVNRRKSLSLLALQEVPPYENVPQLLTDLDQALAAAAAGGIANGGATAPLGWMRERITSVLPLQGVTPRLLLPLQQRPPAATVTAAVSAADAGGVLAAAMPALELDPAVLLPLESLAQNGDVSAQPYGPTPLPPAPRRIPAPSETVTAAVVAAMAGGGSSVLPSEHLLAGAVRLRRSAPGRQWFQA
ncbi:hypothetical protein Vretimale_17670, partial [Volvox reticuliferus]